MEKSLLLQTAILHLDGKEEREDALHSLAILGLYKYLELTDDVVVDSETLQLILSKTNTLFSQLMAKRSKINNKIVADGHNNNISNANNNYDNSRSSNNNSSNDNNHKGVHDISNPKKQGSHRANLTSHFPFADSSGTVFDILAEGTTNNINNNNNNSNNNYNSIKNNNNSNSNSSSNNNSSSNIGNSSRQVRIIDSMISHKNTLNAATPAAVSSSSSGNKSNNKKESAMLNCAFLSMGIPARIRLAKKIFNEFKSGNSGMMLKDAPEAVKSLGIPVSQSLVQACCQFNSRQGKDGKSNKGKTNKGGNEKDFYAIDQHINLDQWLKLINRYTTRNAYVDKISIIENINVANTDRYEGRDRSNNNRVGRGGGRDEDANSSDDSDYNSYGEDTLRRFVIDPDDDNVALAIAAENRQRAYERGQRPSSASPKRNGSGKERNNSNNNYTASPFSDAFSSVADAAAVRSLSPPGRSSSSSSSGLHPAPRVNPRSGAGSKADQGREYMAKLRGVKSVIGDRIRADRTFYNKNSEFVSQSAMSSVASRRVKQLIEKPLPFLYDDDDEENDEDASNFNSRGRYSSADARRRRAHFDRLKDTTSGAAARMICDAFLDSSLAREVLDHRNRYSGQDNTYENDYSFGSEVYEESKQQHFNRSLRERAHASVLGAALDSSNSIDEELAREELKYLIPNIASDNDNNNDNNNNNNNNKASSTDAANTIRNDTKDLQLDNKDKTYISSKASKNGWSADFGHSVNGSKRRPSSSEKDDKFLSTFELGIKPWNRISSSAAVRSNSGSADSRDVSVDIYTSKRGGSSSSRSAQVKSSSKSKANAGLLVDETSSDDEGGDVVDTSGARSGGEDMLQSLSDSIQTSLALKDVV